MHQHMTTHLNNPQEVQVICIDPGFGDCKWLTKSGSGKFSTAIKRADTSVLKFDVKGGDISLNKDEYLFNGSKWYVGNAIAEMNALATRDYSFIEKFAPLIAYKAITDAGLDTAKPIKIKTCLSIMNYENKEAFARAMSTINVNNQVINCEVDVIAQGFASFIDYVVTNDIDSVRMYTVTNIGFNTIDFCVILGGQVIYSTASPNGANEIVKPLRQLLESKFKLYFNEQEVKQVLLEQQITVSGKEVDLSEEIFEIKAQYFETFFYSLPDIREYLRKADKNIFAGGGAYFLQGANLDDNMTFVNEPYEFSDVRGVKSYEQ